MTISQYEAITGTTVASGDSTRVTAEIARARRKLESLLGYTLDPTLRDTNLYFEAGKTSSEYSCPVVNDANLLPPDPVITAYRLYGFNPKDPYLHVDPFTDVNAVKLVYIRQGAAPNGITVKTFDAKYVREYQGRTAWSKYLSEFDHHYHFSCAHSHQLQLAVDAVWQFATIPDELLDVWADMVTHYSDESNNIKSESILTHSYTKFDTGTPEMRSENMRTISRFAGPHGSVSKQVVI